MAKVEYKNYVQGYIEKLEALRSRDTDEKFERYSEVHGTNLGSDDDVLDRLYKQAETERQALRQEFFWPRLQDRLRLFFGRFNVRKWLERRRERAWLEAYGGPYRGHDYVYAEDPKDPLQ